MKNAEIYFQLGCTWQILRQYNDVSRETFDRLISANLTDLIHFSNELKGLQGWSPKTVRNMSFIIRQLWNLINSRHRGETFQELLERADGIIYDITMNGNL